VSHCQRLGEGLDPLLEAGQEGVGVDAVEDPFQRIVRRDAVGRGEEGLKPVLAAPGEGSNRLPSVGPADGRAEGDDDDVDQEVALAAAEARVTKAGEI
jgi:hypothetical protein